MVSVGKMSAAGNLIKALRGDPDERYSLAERSARWLDPEAVLSERARLWLSDDKFRRAYERFDPKNLRRMDRVFALGQFARLAVTLQGQTAECGAYQGASSYFICRQLLGADKLHHVFDSFEGLSTPLPSDGEYWHSGDLASGDEVARRNLAEFDFVRFHKGWIPERFPEVEGECFCLVHIDVDLYDPTRESLEFFFPRLVTGGIIVLDDYGFSTCPGARQAVDEFFGSKKEPVLELPTGQGLVFKQ